MSRSEKPDEDPWKIEVEKVNRSTGKGNTHSVRRSATSGRFVSKSSEKRDPSASEVRGRMKEKENGASQMAKGNDGNRHVVPNKDRGGWDVVKENRERSSGHFDTQKEAEARAREIVDKTSRGNGEVITHGRDGKIRGSDSGRRNETKAKDTK